MKGTDVTPEQLAHAELFLQSAEGWKVGVRGEHTEAKHITVTIAKDDLIRLLAWYGAIRAKSGREKPNPLVNRSGPGDTMDFGTPEQLADMPMPQPLSKVAAARRKIDKDSRDKERS